jgi:hypothetical protein
MFVVLDDEKMRSEEKLVQTFFDVKDALLLEFRISNGAGVLKFAAEDTWRYYSRHLFGTSEALDVAVRRLVGMSA